VWLLFVSKQRDRTWEVEDSNAGVVVPSRSDQVVVGGLHEVDIRGAECIQAIKYSGQGEQRKLSYWSDKGLQKAIEKTATHARKLCIWLKEVSKASLLAPKLLIRGSWVVGNNFGSERSVMRFNRRLHGLRKRSASKMCLVRLLIVICTWKMAVDVSGYQESRRRQRSQVSPDSPLQANMATALPQRLGAL
jgi:hypothetical protein